jgi:iron complex outermembrane receptor protein
MGNRIKALLLASAAMSVLSARAQAETAPATSVEAGATQEVVVTARKTAERIEEVPLAITAYNVKDLADQGVVGLLDISERTPGFVFQTYASTFDSSPTIRGLTQFDVTSSEANVSTIVNGVYIPRNYSVDLGVADVGQIAIIKGPQSALYGGNAFAGVIDYTLNQPTAAPHADVSLTGGAAGRFDAKVDASGSLFDDRIELRGYYADSVYQGTWKNSMKPTTSGSPQELGGHNNNTYGFSVKFKPIDKITAEVDYFHMNRHEDPKPSYNLTSTDPSDLYNCVTAICGKLPTNPLFFASPANTRPPGLLTPPEAGFTSATDFLDASLKAQLLPGLSATYLFGHVRSFATEVTSSADNPVSGINLSYASLFNPPYTFGPLDGDQKEGGVNELNSHELRFDYSLGSFKALLGFYYSSDEDTYQFNIWQAPDGAGISGDPDHPFDFSAFPFALEGHHEVTDTTAEFGRLSYAVLDNRLTFGAEVRHSSDALTYKDTIALITQKATFDTTTPRYTIDFKLTPGTLLYGSAAEGVKEGGFNGIVGADGAFALLPSQQTFQPESNWTYEIGAKNNYFGGRLVLNADLFLVKWKDLQIQEQPLNTPKALEENTSVITTNLGAATSYGLETDGAFTFTPHLLFNYSLALINPTFNDGVTSARFNGICNGVICPLDNSVAGKLLPRTSQVQAFSGLTYRNTIFNDYQWNVHGEFTYQSDQEVEEMNLAQIPARLLINASIGIKRANWDLTLWGKNIFDKKYAADSFFIADGSASYGVSLGELATYGVTLNVHY